MIPPLRRRFLSSPSKFPARALLALLAAAWLAGCAGQLAPDEVAQLKAGEKFWRWSSSRGDFDIHYQEFGSGANHVLLLHGLSANTQSWRDTVGPLAAAGYHVWALDFFGHGLSAYSPETPFHYELLIEQVIAFIEAQRLGRVHLVGNSLGGGISLGVALYASEQVKTLTLVDAAGYPFKLPTLLSFSKNYGWLLKPFMNRWIISQAVHEVVYDQSRATEEMVDIYWRQYTIPGGTDALVSILEGLDLNEMRDLSRLFVDIKAPTLVVWGDKDAWVPVELAYRFDAEIPDSRLAILRDCGHVPQEERPDEFNGILLGFLKEQDAAALTLKRAGQRPCAPIEPE